MTNINPGDSPEITLDRLTDMPEGSYVLIDIRDAISFEYGTLQGAVSEPDIMGAALADRLPKDRKIVLFCMHGNESYAAAQELRRRGYDAVSLHDGYGAYLREQTARQADRSEEIERGLRTRHNREKLLSPFCRAVKQYELIKPGDRIAVCISGGKDSMLMAKLFQELKRQNRMPFELTFLCMDPGYNDLNRLVIENNAAALGVPLTIFESDIFDAVYEIKDSPCYLCARMRRGHLYAKAKELGCNKIALGHHFDDSTAATSKAWSSSAPCI